MKLRELIEKSIKEAQMLYATFPWAKVLVSTYGVYVEPFEVGGRKLAYISVRGRDKSLLTDPSRYKNDEELIEEVVRALKL